MMKKTIQFIIIFGVLASATLNLAAQRSDLAGTWSIDRSLSSAPSEWPLLINIKVSFRGDTLLTERTYETNDGQQYPFSEKLVLNNRDYTVNVYDMPRKMKASWSSPDGSLLFESATTFYGNSGPQDFISKETWKADKQGPVLTIKFVNLVGGTETPGTLVYRKK